MSKQSGAKVISTRTEQGLSISIQPQFERM